MIKILHGADFHLDSPFESLPEEKAMVRRAEQRDILKNMVALAKKEKVDLVLLSGDLLDSGRNYYETSQVMLGTMGSLSVPVFIAPGNHDYYSHTSPYSILKFTDNVHIFKSPEVEKVELKGMPVTVWGAAFTGEASGSLLGDMGSVRGSSRINIMTLHGAVGEPDSRYNPIDERNIARTGLDYLALGHKHSFSGFKRAGDTTYAYPGCPEGRGFDETGEKGVIIAEVSRGSVRGKFVPLAKRKYGILTVDLSASEDAEQTVLEKIPQSGQDIYRIVLDGEYSGKIDTGKILDAVATKFYHVTMKDITRLRRDIWAQAEEDTLKGLFLRKMRAKYEEGGQAEREKVVLAVRYALAAMERGEEWRT